MSEERKMDGRTKRALDTAIAKRQVSQDSYRAVLEGRISLDEAKSLGRGGSPYSPTPKTVSKSDTSRSCMCGCGKTTRGRFAMGHDQRLLKYAYEHLRGERELTPEQLAYVQESGKLERAKARVEREAKKAAKQGEDK
jgi:hypothetical protein